MTGSKDKVVSSITGIVLISELYIDENVYIIIRNYRQKSYVTPTIFDPPLHSAKIIE